MRELLEMAKDEHVPVPELTRRLSDLQHMKYTTELEELIVDLRVIEQALELPPRVA